MKNDIKSIKFSDLNIVQDKFIKNPIQVGEDKSYKLYQHFSIQCHTFRDSCINLLNQTENKTLILYLFYICIELYLKSILIYSFRIEKTNQNSDLLCDLMGQHKKTINSLDHGVREIQERIIQSESSIIILPEFIRSTKIINARIRNNSDLLKVLNLKYTSLRYNCNKSGDIIFEDINIDDQLKYSIEEILSYV